MKIHKVSGSYHKLFRNNLNRVNRVKGKMDHNSRGVLLRLSNKSLLKRRVNRLYPIQYVLSNRQKPVYSENLTGSRQEAAEMWDLWRRFAE